MKKAKIGVVALVTQEYTGSYRSEPFFDNVCKMIEENDIDIIPASKIVSNQADALEVCEEFKDIINGLIMIDINWVVDSQQYILTHNLNVPTMLWALPYNETYSLACVHHYGTCMKWNNKTFEYVIGTYEDSDVVEKIRCFANAVTMINSIKNMKLGLVGPRQTWRVASAQDMTSEELNFSDKFGVTILHIEMTELLNIADKINNDEAKEVLNRLLTISGINELSDEAMLYMVKIYLATKIIAEKYHLDAIAAETCPEYSGLMNLQSSWLGDENFVVDTEGDIGHTMIQYALSVIEKTPALLGEICSVEDNLVYVYHEGSSAHSLAENKNLVKLQKSGDLGCYIGLTMKEIEESTVLSLVGNNGKYKLFNEIGKVEKSDVDEWEKAGTGCLAKVNFGIDGKDVINYLIKNRLDHHYVVKPGNFKKEVAMLCNFLDLEEVNLSK